MTIERREGATELRAAGDGRRVEWMPALYGVRSQDLGGFYEIIRPGAFDRTLRTPQNVLALANHDPSQLLGSTRSGTLQLRSDSRGLHASVLLPDTQLGRDTYELVKRGDLAAGSFAFTVAKGGETWTTEGGARLRYLSDVNLFDATLTPIPAYMATEGTAEARSRLAALSQPSPRVNTRPEPQRRVWMFERKVW